MSGDEGIGLRDVHEQQAALSASAQSAKAGSERIPPAPATSPLGAGRAAAAVRNSLGAPLAAAAAAAAAARDAAAVARDVFDEGVWKTAYNRFYRRGWFWVVTTSFILMEPILCSYDPEKNRTAYWVQVAVLCGSTVCFGIQLVGHVAYKHNRSVKAVSTLNLIDDLRKLIFTGAFILEFFTLLCGWVFIFYRPGIAVLRCFRVFRILYYHELPSGTKEEPGVLEAVKGALSWMLYYVGHEQTADLIFNVCKFASQCLQNMAQEMFFLTEQTRGGFILMVMLFYSAYVVGCALWVETTYIITTPSESCLTLGSCVYTLLRLTFYDGTGLDFLWSLSHNQKFLFAIVVVYLCSTAFGILNGLIGIFGDIFNDSSDEIVSTCARLLISVVLLTAPLTSSSRPSPFLHPHPPLTNSS